PPLENIECIFEEIWTTLRKNKFMGGQPRNGLSVRALDFGRLALSIAESTGELRWQAEACSIMAYVLNANESHSESLTYYEQALEKLDKLETPGRFAQAARL